jgi:hypothetical protein
MQVVETIYGTQKHLGDDTGASWCGLTLDRLVRIDAEWEEVPNDERCATCSLNAGVNGPAARQRLVQMARAERPERIYFLTQTEPPYIIGEGVGFARPAFMPAQMLPTDERSPLSPSEGIERSERELLRTAHGRRALDAWRSGDDSLYMADTEALAREAVRSDITELAHRGDKEAARLALGGDIAKQANHVYAVGAVPPIARRRLTRKRPRPR